MILRESPILVDKAKRKNERSKAALRCANGRDTAKKTAESVKESTRETSQEVSNAIKDVHGKE